MATKKRLIDVNLVDERLANDLKSGDELVSVSWVRSWIGIQETVDAVEVVRCPQCIYCIQPTDGGPWSCGKHGHTLMPIDKDGYCSAGLTEEQWMALFSSELEEGEFE